MTPPLLLPSGLFNVEHRLDGGPNYDGQGFGPFTTPGLDYGLVVHTTETAGVPSYSGGVHPHLTYRPGGKWVQHLPFDRRAGTLRGTSTTEGGKSVPTNRANVFQVEICAYSDYTKATTAGRVAVRDLPAADLQELARWVRWMYDNYGGPGQPLVWFPYQRNTAGIMSHAAWMPADGRRQWFLVDHWGAPDASSHWDSGAINRSRIMEIVATLGQVGPSQPPPPDDPMADWPDILKYGMTHPAVRELRVLLFRAGYRVWSPRKDYFSSGVHWAAKQFQIKVGLIDPKKPNPNIDGVVGAKTRQALRGYL